MTKLTIDQFCNQWLNGGEPRALTSKFEKNLLDFTLAAGRASKVFFQYSFVIGAFAGDGKRWEPRKSKWGQRYSHPVLWDKGLLKESFKDAEGRVKSIGSYNHPRRMFSRGARFDIVADARSVPEKGKRGKSKGYGWYAAIHNGDPSTTNYSVNQYSRKKPIRRQFIGLSSKLDSQIERFIPIIFSGFPLS